MKIMKIKQLMRKQPMISQLLIKWLPNPMKQLMLRLLYHPIKIEKDGAVFKATHDGKEWFIPTNSKDLALWAFTFIDFYVKEFNDRYLDAISESDTVVEVGACTGEYTIPAAQRASRVLAFEADPLGCECVRKNARLHNLNNIEVINKAVSDRDGERVSLHTPRYIASGALVRGDTMSATTIDSFLKGIKVDVLKITVNGHEPEVIAGAAKTLEGVRSVVFQSARHKELLKILEEQGFKVKKFKQFSDDTKTVLMERAKESY